jgi:hypothetical protein
LTSAGLTLLSCALLRKVELDGIRDGCPVKLIFKDDGQRKQWFEKPKDFGTLHFEEEAGILTVHMDSADNQQFREMTPIYPIALLQEYGSTARNWYSVLLGLAIVFFAAVQVRDQMQTFKLCFGWKHRHA